jgi:hypothetical protein
MNFIEHLFNTIVQYSILLLGFAGVGIIVVTPVQSILCLFRKRQACPTETRARYRACAGIQIGQRSIADCYYTGLERAFHTGSHHTLARVADVPHPLGD